MGNGLSGWGRISSFNLGLLCGSRRDKARAGLACVVNTGWLVLLGGRGGCGAVSLSVVYNAGALISSFPSSIGVQLEGLRIGCGVTGVRVSWGICGSARLSSLIRRLWSGISCGGEFQWPGLLYSTDHCLCTGQTLFAPLRVGVVCGRCGCIFLETGFFHGFEPRLSILHVTCII